MGERSASAGCRPSRPGSGGSGARVGLLAAGVTLLVPPLWADGDPGRAPALALALVAGGTVRALTILVLCVGFPAAVDRRVRSALPDLCFFGARALTVVALALA